MAPASREYLVYADGSCLGNPGPGGWGVVVRDRDGHVTELNGYAPSTTNNRMELMAAIEGLRATEPGAVVTLRSDSQYVVNSMTLHWKRNKNQDLWELLDAETKSRRVSFEWVRGHGDDPTNNRADELALSGANRRLIADGASMLRREPRASNNDDLMVETELSILLKRGESIRECAGCGAKFVSRRAGEDYCSLILCQFQARSDLTK
ncbi:ribonuclease H family protein [Candidatus Binatus sp.]|uniref:ribonuclease H family protein n=1 Tax=Candidatus Binatus sp. TaxID=2811406 RepID=UPI003C73AAE8